MAVKDWASFYYEKGLIIIPLAARSKRAVVDSWPTLSREELFSKIDDRSNIGLRLDSLVVLDIEDPRMWPLFFTASVEEIAKHTWFCRTGGGGFHVYFAGQTKPFKVDDFAELRSGGGMYVVCPPSIHPDTGRPYEWVTNIHEVDIAPLSAEGEKKLRAKLEALREHAVLIRVLVDVWIPEHRHNLALPLSGILRKAGIPLEEAEIVIKAVALLANDGELSDRLRALADTYSKKDERLAGWSYLREELSQIVGQAETGKILSLLPAVHENEEKIEERKKTRYCVGGEKIGDALIEVVVTDDGPALLLYDGQRLEVTKEKEINGEVLRPYPDLPFALPRVPERIDEDSTLGAETREFIKTYFDSPANELVYDVLTAAVAWSYFVQDIQGSTPYLLFLGPWRSGKTRALETLAALCYKSTFLVDPSEASLFRMIEVFRPTLLIDESQILDPNVRAVMAAGYRWGAKVPRVVDPEADGLDGLKFFDVFGLKLYASREQPPDDIYSRSIVVHCERNLRPTAKKIDMERAAELRTRWLSQKLRLFGKFEVTYEEFASDDGRIQELFSPLVKMAEIFGDNSTIEKIVEYGRSVEAEIKSVESDTPEADVLHALVSIIQEKRGDVPELVAVSEIAEKLNNGDLHGPWTPEKVGRRLSTLGFRRARLPGGKRAYLIDYPLLGRLSHRYRIDMDLQLLQRVAA